VENLDRYASPRGVGGEKDPRVPTPADLTLDLIPTSESLAYQRQYVAPNEGVL
jgi:hypothetical protein